MNYRRISIQVKQTVKHLLGKGLSKNKDKHTCSDRITFLLTFYRFLRPIKFVDSAISLNFATVFIPLSLFPPRLLSYRRKMMSCFISDEMRRIKLRVNLDRPSFIADLVLFISRPAKKLVTFFSITFHFVASRSENLVRLSKLSLKAGCNLVTPRRKKEKEYY